VAICPKEEKAQEGLDSIPQIPEGLSFRREIGNSLWPPRGEVGARGKQLLPKCKQLSKVGWEASRGPNIKDSQD
jgi:hypothetical protein